MKKKKTKKEKFRFPKSINSFVILLSVAIILGIFGIGKSFVQSQHLSKTNEVNVATPSPTNASPTDSPTITAKPVYVDPDPITNCTSSYPQCVGQSISLKRSQCQNITCCQIGNKWTIYTTSASCTEDQQANNPTSNSNSTKVLINVDDGGGITHGSYYCYADKVNTISNMESLIRIEQTTADICNSAAQSEASNCSSGCSTVPDISGCVNSCYSNVNSQCSDKNNTVGNSRRQLYAEVQQDCP